MARILIIGNGGREHALLWKLAQNPNVDRLFVAPENSAIESAISVRCADIQDITNNSSIIEFCKKENISMVVVGPELPLSNGIVDSLTTANIACFGPTRKAAQIESSKAFSKEFMVRNGIPTAKFKSFSNSGAAKEFLTSNPTVEYFVVKASGLAFGKGVVVANDLQEALDAIDFVAQFGNEIVLEERLAGEEISALCFTDGITIKAMPFAQDHKRLLENDQGPNTGGMGAFAPYPFVSERDMRFIEDEILLKTITCLKKEGIEYKGVLYAGLMLTKDGPKVLEYNCRFGDPETQVLIPLLRSDLFEIMEACVNGRLNGIPILWSTREFACGIVLASGGYPNSPEIGFPIEETAQIDQLPGVTVFYAGAKKTDQGLVTSGGRVLCAVAIGETLGDAVVSSLQAAKIIHFDGCQYRLDIARKALKRLSTGSGLTYANAGVDIIAGDTLVQNIKSACASTARLGSDVVELGGFGALFDLKKTHFKDPILVSGTDGVGTKLAIAQESGYHETVGMDLVAMCVNDVLTLGAEPLFFLDYYATGKLNVDVATSVIKGIATGCKDAKCALIGGETAEMPGFYAKCEYDLAGFAVGAVERDHIPDKANVSVGDVILGLPSTGLHSNGFSLARKIIREKAQLQYNELCPWDVLSTVGQALLKPTKIYVKEILPAFKGKLIKMAAHITGGGLVENVPRILPANTKAVIDMKNWDMPKVFTYLQVKGDIPAHEMVRTFNCGIGFVLIVSPDLKDTVKRLIQAENGEILEIGCIQERGSSDHPIEINGLQDIFPSKHDFINGFETDGKKRVAVLISGSGTNLQALIDYAANNAAAYEIVLVISNVTDVKGLERAQRAGIATKVIKHEKKSRNAFEDEIHATLLDANVELICLAGFMRILTENFVKKWTGRMINVHPSLLPLFKGAHAHKLVLESSVRLTGCSVHFVEPEVDAGGIILQGTAPVYPDDNEDTLSERVKLVEHRIFPKALDSVARGDVRRGDKGGAEWVNVDALKMIME